MVHWARQVCVMSMCWVKMTFLLFVFIKTEHTLKMYAHGTQEQEKWCHISCGFIIREMHLKLVRILILYLLCGVPWCALSTLRYKKNSLLFPSLPCRRLEPSECPLQMVYDYLAALGYADPVRVQQEAANSDLSCLIRFYSGEFSLSLADWSFPVFIVWCRLVSSGLTPLKTDLEAWKQTAAAF